MGKFPVISITLKGATGENFEEAKVMLRRIIGKEAMRFRFLLESDRIDEAERSQYEALISTDKTGTFTMSDDLLKDSLLILSQFLQKHYGQAAVMLIDEYDVPLVKDVRYKEYFGFTDAEVRQMLEYYGLEGQYDAVKEWYDGYLFGNLGIYCPWDVINYCGDLRDGSVSEPQNYWVNTSSNDIIRKFISRATASTKSEIEQLMNGGSIKKKIRQELTYRDLDSQADNLWSVLFTTGYLTQCAKDDNGMTSLIIPNKEIQWIFEEQIQEWFETESTKDTQKLENFCRAFEENDTAAIERGFTSYLRKTISIRDTSVKKGMKENFYHGILLGLFAGMEGWKVKSNAESGDGYSDISVEVEDRDIGIVIELKYAENAAFENACKEALEQIHDRNYEELLVDDGMKTIYRYGIACYKKRCQVVSG